MALFGNSGEVSGYNCAQVESLREIINSTAQQSGSEITQILHDGIVTPMSSVWYAPEAVEFFNGFAEVVKTCGTNITEAFDAFRQNVQKAGANWAENTGGQAPTLAAIDQVELTLTVSEIQPDNAGNVTIDEGQANTIAGNLSQVEQDIKAKLEGLAGNLDAATAFIGHGQGEAVQNCFVKISGEIHRIFRFLTEGDESLQSRIKAAAEKYATVSSELANNFDAKEEFDTSMMATGGSQFGEMVKNIVK